MNLKTKLYSYLGKSGAARNIFGAVIWPGGRPVIQRAIVHRHQATSGKLKS